jgi:hypothetical protein
MLYYTIINNHTPIIKLEKNRDNRLTFFLSLDWIINNHIFCIWKTNAQYSKHISST